jgi:hypothetical protein
MSGRNAEYRGYMTTCQSADRLIHLLTSREHYTFNLKWLQTPQPALSHPPLRVNDIVETFTGPDKSEFFMPLTESAAIYLLFSSGSMDIDHFQIVPFNP